MEIPIILVTCVRACAHVHVCMYVSALNKEIHSPPIKINQYLGMGSSSDSQVLAAGACEPESDLLKLQKKKKISLMMVPVIPAPGGHMFMGALGQ